MMQVMIPDSKWQPLSLTHVVQLFARAPFMWGIAGGYAVEQFLGAPIREHSDTDIIVYRDEQLQVQSWLPHWQLYASDPPGTHRPWGAGEYLPYGIQDIWGHRSHVEAWELQIMVTEVDGDRWYMRGNPQIQGRRDDLVVRYNDVPCIRVEVQLLYKSRRCRPKDTADFQACVAHLPPDTKLWLRDQLLLLHPMGHAWLHDLG
jgi:hypothetical protein